MAGQGSRSVTPASREAINQSRRFTDDTRSESIPGNGSRQDTTSDRLSGTPHASASSVLPPTLTHRDLVDQLEQLYGELGIVTFDFVDGRLLSGPYQTRRAHLCREIRQRLLAIGRRPERMSR